MSHQRWHDHRLFLSHFRKNPRTVGAIAPSSQALARAMLDGLALDGRAPGDDAAARVGPVTPVRIVELGPGTGAITREIARRLPAGATCLAIDVNPDFSARVAARWPNITSICDRAERLIEIAGERGLLPIQHIISGLPFASLPSAIARQIVDAIVGSLAPGGTFTTFQYAHAFGFPSAVSVRRTLTQRMGSGPTRRFVLGNLPPALVVRWTRELDEHAPDRSLPTARTSNGRLR